MALQICFWTSAVLICWTTIFYPLLMVASVPRARVRARAATPVDWQPRVTVIVAAFNEERHIAGRIANLLQQEYPAGLLNILVGSDGSTDGTVTACRQAANARRVTVCEFPRNRGKASVLNDLCAMSDAEVLVFTDANTVFAPQTVARLVAPLADRQVGAVCGELVLSAPADGDNQDHVYWNVEQRLKVAESRIGGLLGATGGVYAIRRELFQPLGSDTICDDFVMAMNVTETGFRLVYAPEAVAFEESPADVAAEFGRRVRIGIGNYQILFRRTEFLWRGPWVRRFTYFSHKVLRWLTPVLLAVLTLSAGCLAPTHPYVEIFLLLCLGYCAALVIFLSRKRVAWPAPLRAGMLFLVLNAAFVVALVRFAAGSYQASWRRTERT